MKTLFAFIVVMLAAFGCATEEKVAAPAPAECKPQPRELQTQELEPGQGEAVRFRSAVLVNYTGWVYDGCAKDLKGAQFDTSIGKPTPFGFIVGAGRVIRGWDEGVVGMQEGGKRVLIIPASKGYGAQGVAGRIPPNSALVFEVNVVKVLQQPQ